MSSPWALIKSDLYRHTGRISIGLIMEHLLLNAGFAYMFWFWFRLCRIPSVARFLC